VEAQVLGRRRRRGRLASEPLNHNKTNIQADETKIIIRGGEMVKGKIGIIGIMVLGILGAAALTQAEPIKVNQVVYITKSKACGCSAKSFHDADALVNRTFTGPRQALLKRIDYDTDRQAAVPYIGEYRLIQLPALLFLDAQNRMLWMAVGEVAKEDVAAKLSQFGS
jgi:hypothetical protein